jgi:hypothetical protein
VSRRADRRARRRVARELDWIGRLFDSGEISAAEYADRSRRAHASAYTPEQRAQLIAEDKQRMRTARAVHEATRPPDFLRCPVCSHVVPDHSDACVFRPGADLSAPRGGIEYLRARGFATLATPDLTASAGTPLYDELAAERRIDPCRDAAIRRDEETFRELSERFARSARVPGPLMQQQELVIRAADDPIVEHARELYRLGHFGDVGSFPARRALARMISGRAIDDVRPRTRTGWGQPIERTDP